jgi:DNA mismatch endonuclease (patch repair protein)
MDQLSPAQRSELMGRIHARGTKPEIAVRRLVHGMGYRYRVNSPKFTGKPDLAFPGRKKAIFVHGCFWHAHPGCRRAFSPKTRPEYWQAKLGANRARDARVCADLEAQGWSVCVIWECEVGSPDIADRLFRFLGAPGGAKRGWDAVRDQR